MGGCFDAEGIALGTRWEDVPGDWICPEYGSEKGDYMSVGWE